MSLSRPLVALVGVGVLGLACVGAGAGATFTDATHSLQSINTGTINVTLNSPTATWGNDSKSIGFKDISLAGSSFVDAPQSITMTNNGTMAAKYVYFNISTTLPAAPTAQDSKLLSELNVCIYSPADLSTGVLMFDGPVSTFYASPGGLGLDLTGGSLEPKATDSYSIEFYAGDVTTKCGLSGYAPLSQEAMGGSVGTSVDITYQG